MVEAVNGAATTNIVQILKLTFTACIAFGTATATLVSQSLGRKEPEEAARSVGRACGSGSSSSASSVCCEGLLVREQVISIFAATTGVKRRCTSR